MSSKQFYLLLIFAGCYLGANILVWLIYAVFLIWTGKV